MAQPRTGEINREWYVETIKNTVYAAGGSTFSSAKFPYVEEAYFLRAQGTILANQPNWASVIAHNVSLPDQGSIGATVAATLGSSSWKAGLYLLGGTVANPAAAEIGAGTIINSTWLVRGR